MSFNQPKISVIVPVYNVEKYIDECLDSLVGQTLRDIEIICVDDCSTDGSVEIIRKYLARDSRLKLIQRTENGGLSASRNDGIKNSTAPYLLFCDSDDFYACDMCEKMLHAIEGRADIAICGINVIYESNQSMKESDDKYYRLKYSGLISVSDDVLGNCDVSACNKIFKRDIINKHNVCFPLGLKYEDAYFFNAYMLWARKIAFCNKKLYNYRRRPGSIMAQTFKKDNIIALDHLTIAIKFFDYLNEHDLYIEKYKYFWEKIFIPFFLFVIWNCYQENYLVAAFNIARNFVNDNYKWGSLNFGTERTLHMIMNGTLERSKKYLFGLIRLVEHVDAKKVRFCGILIYKVRYFPDYIKYYLFGIQYKIKHF